MPIPRPLCFMIMPYGRKPTQAEAGHGPAEIDFNALWDRGYFPVIRALGYEPIRADQDTGALIITQMLERLYFADLVLADITIANSNVYYEIGIRHAAKEKGCVLLAADWSRQLFDVAQMRTVRYPLDEGDVTELTAQRFSGAIQGEIQRRARGLSPMHTAIHGFPLNVDERAASTMKDQMTELAKFQADVRTARAVPGADRMARAQELVARYGIEPMMPAVALALLGLLRDSADKPDDWKVVLGFIGKLPKELTTETRVREHFAFALSNSGKHVEAIAELDALNQEFGPTPERLGVMGGRYKRLLAMAKTPQEKLMYLNKSIESYERGMDLDLNEYYCSSNLPRLYRERSRKGDAERAQSVLTMVIAACERAKRRGMSDEWLRPTLLVAAVDAGDAGKAEELYDYVAEEGPARWKLDSIVHDLEKSAALIEDPARRERLDAVVAKLKAC
jgi:hypothetical protein